MQQAPANSVFQNPLLQPRMVSRLTLCRKYIFQEFGTKLNLQQKDIVEQIKGYADTSVNPSLKHLARELEINLN